MEFSLGITLEEIVADLTYPYGRHPRLAQAAAEDAAEQAARRFLRPRRGVRPDAEQALLDVGEPLVLPDGLAGTRWGSGAPVLLVHGWEGRGTQLGAFVPPLVRLGCSVVALDAPAHGDSAGDETSPSRLRAAITGVGAQLGQLRAVIAHSAGGLGALLAITAGLRTERLVLLAAPASYAATVELVARLAHLPGELVPRMREIVEERIGVSLHVLDGTLLGVRGDLPGLVIYDPADPEVPYAAAEALVGGWPAATLRPAQGLGHRDRLLTDPAVVAEVAMFVMGGPG